MAADDVQRRARNLGKQAIRGGTAHVTGKTEFAPDRPTSPKPIARFKLPERLEVVDAFPLTGVGKVSKGDLREDITRKLAAEAERGR